MKRPARPCLVLLAALGLTMLASHAESATPDIAGFDIDGLTLSMPFEAFRRLYPDAKVTERTAVRYCYGKEIKTGSPISQQAVIRRGNATVHVTFDLKDPGQKISTIERDAVIEFDPSQFEALRDGLVGRYGPYTQIRYADKMDPYGLIVGFDWEQKGIAHLSVTIHRDHKINSGAIYQTAFLMRSRPGMERPTSAARHRDAVQDFREKCPRR